MYCTFANIVHQFSHDSNFKKLEECEYIDDFDPQFKEASYFIEKIERQKQKQAIQREIEEKERIEASKTDEQNEQELQKSEVLSD